MLAPSRPSTLELIARFRRLCELTAASSDPDGCVTTSFQCGVELAVSRVSVRVAAVDVSTLTALGPGRAFPVWRNHDRQRARRRSSRVTEKRAVPPSTGGPCCGETNAVNRRTSAASGRKSWVRT